MDRSVAHHHHLPAAAMNIDYSSSNRSLVLALDYWYDIVVDSERTRPWTDDEKVLLSVSLNSLRS
jgi:hypothetical protein